MLNDDACAKSATSPLILAALILLVQDSERAWAYEPETHRELSIAAVSRSTLGFPSALSKLGLRPLLPNDVSQQFPRSQGTITGPLSIVDLIAFGSAWEDDLSITQALRHFYDPVNDRELDITETVGTSLSIKSPDWALEDLRPYSSDEPQRFSFKDARQYMYEALASPTSETQRKKQFGLMFQSLGHVIHHLQDMAQPQHARNDVHCDKVGCKYLAILTGSGQFYRPSLFEKYSDLDHATDRLKQIRPNLPFHEAGSNPAYPGAELSTNPFGTPRRFWRTTLPGEDIGVGKGIAEYTNRNFYSADSMRAYASPPPPQGLTQYFSPTDSVDIGVLMPGASLTGRVNFWSSEVHDALAGGAVTTNPRALSEGLLDADLAQYYSTGQPGFLVYALNRFTYDAAHQFLIPRAVGYSAGLINYFFRGELEITAPDEGIYSVIDHTVENQPTTGGFRYLKLKIKNVTPAGALNGQPQVEHIPSNGGGTLVAVAKFNRNLCYQPDLSGEYGSPQIQWQDCRSSAEEIKVSQPITIATDINLAAKAFTFDFGANKVPINATDLHLQVVYRGPLGEELDSVVVATKDISEPTYIYQHARWDQYTYGRGWPIVEDGDSTYANWCAAGFPSTEACNQAMGLTWKLRFGPTPGYTDNPVVPENTWYPLASEPPFDPMVTMVAPVGKFNRIAVLADLAPLPLVVVLESIDPTHGTSTFQWQRGSWSVALNQLVFPENTLTPSKSYTPGRGIFVEAVDGFLLNSGDASPMPALSPAASQIVF